MGEEHEQEISVKITTAAQLEGVRQAKKELEDLRKNTAGGTKEFSELTKQIDALDKASKGSAAKTMDSRAALLQQEAALKRAGVESAALAKKLSDSAKEMEKAGVSVKQFDKATEHATHKVHLFGMSHRQLHMSMHAISQMIPGLNIALRMLSGPVGLTMAAFLAFGKVLESVKEKIKEQEEFYKEFTKSATESTSKFSKHQAEVLEESSKGWADFMAKMKNASALHRTAMEEMQLDVAALTRSYEALKIETQELYKLQDARNDLERERGNISESGAAIGKIAADLGRKKQAEELEIAKLKEELAAKEAALAKSEKEMHERTESTKEAYEAFDKEAPGLKNKLSKTIRIGNERKEVGTLEQVEEELRNIQRDPTNEHDDFKKASAMWAHWEGKGTKESEAFHDELSNKERTRINDKFGMVYKGPKSQKFVVAEAEAGERDQNIKLLEQQKKYLTSDEVKKDRERYRQLEEKVATEKQRAEEAHKATIEIQKQLPQDRAVIANKENIAKTSQQHAREGAEIEIRRLLMKPGSGIAEAIKSEAQAKQDYNEARRRGKQPGQVPTQYVTDTTGKIISMVADGRMSEEIARKTIARMEHPEKSIDTSRYSPAQQEAYFKRDKKKMWETVNKAFQGKGIDADVSGQLGTEMDPVFKRLRTPNQGPGIAIPPQPPQAGGAQITPNGSDDHLETAAQHLMAATEALRNASTASKDLLSRVDDGRQWSSMS